MKIKTAQCAHCKREFDDLGDYTIAVVRFPAIYCFIRDHSHRAKEHRIWCNEVCMRDWLNEKWPISKRVGKLDFGHPKVSKTKKQKSSHKKK